MEKNWPDNTVVRAIDAAFDLERQVIHSQSSFGAGYLGKHVYRTDRDLLYRYDGFAWHSYSKGRMGRGTPSGQGPFNSTNGEVAIAGTSTTISGLVVGELYEARIDLRLRATNTDNTVVQIKLYRDSTQINQDRAHTLRYFGAAYAQSCTLVEDFTVTSTSHTFLVVAKVVIGSGSVDCLSGGTFVIDHVGS